MPPVIIDDMERKRIRDALAHYQRLHGEIGAPELHLRMMNVLGLLDEQLSLSTLQRFLKAKGRTEDITVRRYQKFLELVAPLDYADELGTALDNAMLYPASPPRPDVSAFQGRYALSLRRLGDESAAAGDARLGLILTPTRNPLFLKSILFRIGSPGASASDPHGPEVMSFGAFVPCGIGQFLLSSARFANASFALLSQTASEPVVLSGAMIETATPAGHEPAAHELRLTMIEGVPRPEGQDAR